MIWASIEKEHDKLHEEIENLIKIQVWVFFVFIIIVFLENKSMTFKETKSYCSTMTL